MRIGRIFALCCAGVLVAGASRDDTTTVDVGPRGSQPLPAVRGGWTPDDLPSCPDSEAARVDGDELGPCGP